MRPLVRLSPPLLALSVPQRPGWLAVLFPGPATWLARRAARVMTLRSGLVAQVAEAERRALAAQESLFLQQARMRGLGQLPGLEQKLAAERLSPLPALPPGGPVLEPYVDAGEMETLILRALARFAGLPQQQAESAWTAWETAVRGRFPANVAAEILRRAMEARSRAA